MPLNNNISSILGAKIPYWLWSQFQTRSKKSSSQNRDNEIIKYIANKTAWVRLVSSINIKDSDLVYFQRLNPEIQGGDSLAKQYVLFGGTSKYLGNNTYSLRSGFSGMDGSNPYGAAYGMMGKTGDNDEVAKFGYRPMPGIVSVNIETQGRLGSVRSATVNFKCWSKDQLDVIDALYFKLGFTMFLEWGQTYYFPSENAGTAISEGESPGNQPDPNKALSTELMSIDPFDQKYLNNKEEIFKEIAKNNRQSFGNYDGMLGIVTNFNFSYNQEGGYDCVLKIMSLGVLGDSIKVNNSSKLLNLLGEEIKEYNTTLKFIQDTAAIQSGPVKIDNSILVGFLESGKGDGANANIESFAGSNSLFKDNTTIDTKTYGSLLYIKKQDRFLPEKIETYSSKIKLSTQDIKNVISKAKIDLGSVNSWRFGADNPNRYEVAIQYKSAQPQYLNSRDNVIDKEGYKITFTGPVSTAANLLAYGFLDTRATNINVPSAGNKTVVAGLPSLLAGKNIQLLEKIQGLEEPGLFTSGNTVSYTVRPLPGLENKDAFNLVYEQLGIGINSIFNSDGSYTLRSITKEFMNGAVPTAYRYTFEIQALVPVTLPSSITVRNVRSTTQTPLPDDTYVFDNIDLTYYVPINIKFQETDFIKSFETSDVIEQLQPIKKKKDDSAQTENPDEEQTKNALSYLSNLELALRSIQVHSLVYAIKKTKGSIKNVVDVPLYEKNSEQTLSFAQQIFSNGLFTPFFQKLVDGSIDNAKDSQLSVYAKYGFATKLLANQEKVDRFMPVNYKSLLTSYVLPYEVNQVLETGAQMERPVYIQLGTFLMLINHSCTLYDTQGKEVTPVVYVDYNPNHSLCLTTPLHLSTDPFTAMIPFEGSLKQYAQLFDPDVLTKDGSYKILATTASARPMPLLRDRESPTIEKDTISGYIPAFNGSGVNNSLETDNSSQIGMLNRGFTMNILLNIDYLMRTVSQFAKKDGENKVFLKPLLENIISDVNKSIGNFNIFRLAYNDTGNVFHVVDDQIVPDGTLIYAIKQPGDDPTEIPVFGKQSIAKNLEIRTDISTRLSNMLAISANSEKKLGDNSTDGSTFGFINYNYTDRYVSERGEVTGSNVDPKGEIYAANQFNTAIVNFYAKKVLDENSVSPATNYYIDKLTKNRAIDSATRAAAMIPVSLNFTTDGISGLYMGQAFTVDPNFLPYTYSIKKMFNDEPADDKVGFVITGVSHAIEGNVWNTSVKTNMIFLKKKSDYEPAPKVENETKKETKKEEVLPVPNDPNIKTSYPELPRINKPASELLPYKVAKDKLLKLTDRDTAKAVFAIIFAETSKKNKSFVSVGGHNYAGVQTDAGRWGKAGEVIIGRFITRDAERNREFAQFPNDDAFLKFMVDKAKQRNFSGTDSASWAKSYLNKWVFLDLEKQDKAKYNALFPSKVSIFNNASANYDNIA